MIGDPPFVVSDDAEALTVSEQMFGFQGSLYKFPPRSATPNLAIFLTVLKGGGGGMLVNWCIGKLVRAELAGSWGWIDSGRGARKVDGRGGVLTSLAREQR
jgi:hypothetical protein